MHSATGDYGPRLMCVSGCRSGRMASGPGCEGAVSAGEHAAEGTVNWGGGGGSSLGWRATGLG